MISDLSLARPYAVALARLAAESASEDRWAQTLVFLSVCAEDPGFRAFAGRQKDPAQTLAFLEKLGPEFLWDESRAFVMQLLKSRKFFLVPKIFRLFTESVQKARGEAELRLTFSVPVGKDDEAALVKRLEERFACKLHATVEIDPAIVGGFVARVGDRIIDASVRGSLESLTRSLPA